MWTRRKNYMVSSTFFSVRVLLTFFDAMWFFRRHWYNFVSGPRQ